LLSIRRNTMNHLSRVSQRWLATKSSTGMVIKRQDETEPLSPPLPHEVEPLSLRSGLERVIFCECTRKYFQRPFTHLLQRRNRAQPRFPFFLFPFPFFFSFFFREKRYDAIYLSRVLPEVDKVLRGFIKFLTFLYPPPPPRRFLLSAYLHQNYGLLVRAGR